VVRDGGGSIGSGVGTAMGPRPSQPGAEADGNSVTKSNLGPSGDALDPPIWHRSRPVGVVFMPRPNGVFCTGAAVAARIYRWRRVGVGYSM
jgi:hypothetical protein